MTGTRFITKNGTSVDPLRMPKLILPAQSKIWRDAMQGDADARELIEQICGIEIVDADTGFGFP